MSNLLLVIFVSVLAQVTPETDTDVIESFAQIFEKLHEDVTDIQLKTHGAINGITQHFSSTLRNTQFALTRYQNDAKISINEQVHDTLDLLNLLSNNNKVQECIKDNNDAIEEMIIKSEGGLQVCKNLNTEKVDDVNAALSGVYINQEKLHLDLEGSKMFCNATNEDIVHLKNCLYYQLFVVHVNSIQELKPESKEVVKKYGSVVIKAGEKLKKCSNIVQKIIFEEADQIALKFRNCCHEIMQTKYE